MLVVGCRLCFFRLFVYLFGWVCVATLCLLLVVFFSFGCLFGCVCVCRVGESSSVGNVQVALLLLLVVGFYF